MIIYMTYIAIQHALVTGQYERARITKHFRFFFSALVSSYINNFEFLYNFEKCKNHTFMVLLISNSIINLEPRVFQYVLFLWHIKSSVEDIILNTIKNLGGILLE